MHSADSRTWHLRRRERCDAGVGPGIGRGLLNALLIAVPLWVVLGVALDLVFLHRPMDESTSAALMLAFALETMLLRPYARALWTRGLRHAQSNRAASNSDDYTERKHPTRRIHVGPEGLRSDLDEIAERRIESIEDLLHYVAAKYPPSRQELPGVLTNALFKRTLALSALVGSYLQYYFWDVNLQIASLNSLTVFLPVASTT